MATVSTKVYEHHKKADGTYNVKIRVYHKEEKKFIDTPHFLSLKQLAKVKGKKEFNIKDPFVLDIVDKKLRDYRKTISELEDKLDDPKNGAIIYPGPILDGKLVIETAENAYKNGRQPNIPLIIGSNSAEVPAGFVNSQSKEQLFSKFEPHNREAMDVYDPEGNRTLPELLTMVNTDKVWAEPARLTARAFSRKGAGTYSYLFDYVQTALQQQFVHGAPHASEIPYVFNTISSRDGTDLTEKDRKVASMMNTYWANFAKTGNPNSRGLPNWEKFNGKKDNLLEIRRDGTAVSVPDPKKKRLDVIEKVTKKLK
ncbi:carboxylesterase family protein [Sphingobacterium daejeonense]|uniref:Carboxylesterase family protein n=1 Tax=Sphingobacterium daejeonense TaxID=371142 RepID=A0ABW3RGJ9_9SPHI